MLKKKYIAVIVIKEQSSYTILETYRVDPSIPNISYKKAKIPINIGVYSYSKGLKQYYYFDKDTEKQLFFQGTKEFSVKGKTADMILAQKTIEKLTSNLNSAGWKLQLFNIIIGLALGLAFGFIIKGYIP